MKDQLENKSIEEIVRIKPVILLIDWILGITGGKVKDDSQISVYIPDYLILRIIYHQLQLLEALTMFFKATRTKEKKD